MNKCSQAMQSALEVLTLALTRPLRSVWTSIQVLISLYRRVSLSLANASRSSAALPGSGNCPEAHTSVAPTLLDRFDNLPTAALVTKLSFSNTTSSSLSMMPPFKIIIFSMASQFRQYKGAAHIVLHAGSHKLLVKRRPAVASR